MPDRRPRGRPALPPEQARTRLLQVRLSPAELAGLTAAAEARGLSVADFVRSLAKPSKTRKRRV